MKKRFDRLRFAATVAAGAVAVLFCATTARADAPMVLRGHVPAAVTGLQPVGRLDATNRLHLAVGLPLRNAAGMSALLQQIYDPASPQYHHYLTPAQFTEAFGPTQEDYQKVIDFFKANRMVTTVQPNRLLLDVDAPVADVEKLLHVTMQLYNHPTEARTFFAPDSEPSLDVSLPILHIGGLDNYFVAHPNYTSKPISQLSRNRPALGSGAGGTYLGKDFRSAYVPGVALDGSGQKLALFEFDTYYAADIAQYESAAQLPAVVLTNVPVGGFSGPPGGENGEVALDIEMAVSMAPGLSQILIYEAPNVGFSSFTDDLLSKIATDDSANQISASWSYPIDSISDGVFLEMQLQGQTFLNSSGDSGAYLLGEVPTPSGNTNVTVVGGTTLFTSGAGGPWQSETVWNWFTEGEGDAAGSGGIDTNNPIPPWQKGINMSQNGGSTKYRNLPDVAMTADNIFVVADNGVPQEVGGTSAATPLWAGFMALVNEQAFTSGKPPMGFIAPAIYSIASGSLYASTFHDIVTGNNTNFVSSNLFSAVPGFDLCTGWGTPNGSNLINALSPIVLTPVLTVATNILTGGNGNGVIDYDECNKLTIVLTNEGTSQATAVLGVLSSLTPGVIVAQGSSDFQNIPPHGEAINLSSYSISTEPTFVCGTPVQLMLIVKSAQVIQTNFLQLPSGLVGVPVTFSSETPTNIPTTNFGGSFSPLVVSNLESVAHLTVSLNITSQYDFPLSIELVSPDGTTVDLSENNGGLGQGYGNSCSPNSETTFDDAAQVPITAGVPPYIGSFSPQQPLAAYNLKSGTNLNGIWLLHVFNQFEYPYPAELQCWSLNISPYLCEDGGGACPGADLSVAMSASPNPVVVGSNLVYSLLISNGGPNTASGIVISQSLPAGVNFLAVTNYVAGVNQFGSNLDLTLSSIPVYGTALLAVVTVPTVPGLAVSTASVGSPAPDSNPNNNSASASVQVTLPTADLGVSMTVTPLSVLQGGPITYTISVTNNGPFGAEQVLLNNSLPPNVNLISAVTSQGTVGPGATTVQLGTLASGSNAVVTIVISPTITGNLTASTAVTLGPLQTDPNSFNNAASVTVTVGPSADLSVSAVAVPAGDVLSGSNFICVATVMNNGPSAATSVVFDQTIPAGASLVSSSRAGVTVDNGVISWGIGSLPSGSSVVITNVLQAPTLLFGVESNLLSSSLTVFGQPGDSWLANNTFILKELVQPPTITVVPAGVVLTQPASGNGTVNPQESVQVQFNLRNTGNISTTNLVATLQGTGGVSFPSAAQSYGALPPGGAASGRLFTFTAKSTNGGTVVATLQLQDGSASLGSATFVFVMPVIATFSNTNEIDVPSSDFVPQPESGPAHPYPSPIVVSNVTGLVSDVSVTISNMTHSYPHDVGMMLIGPTGMASALMVAAANYSTISGVTFTIDPNATVPLPATGYIVSGSYQPEDYDPSFVFTNAPVTNPVVNLTGYDGRSPNGTWSLYVYDGVNEDAGVISNGWSLTITTISPVNPVSDLVANVAVSSDKIVLGDTVTYYLGVTNAGENTADPVFLTNVLSPGLTFVSSSVASGAYTQNGQTTIYSLGSLAPGAGLTITNVVTVTVAGSLTNAIAAGSLLPSGNSGNNKAVLATSVMLPDADIGAFISIPTNQVVLGNNMVYTLVVTNYGPSNAASVAGSFTLAGLNLVSVPGNAVSNNGAVQINFGTILAGNIATAVITTAPPAAITLTNVWSVSTSDNDTNPLNNSTNSVITVVVPFPEITAGGASLLTSTPNGGINPGQAVTVALTLNNVGSGPTSHLVATLLPTNGITPGALSQQTYGALPLAGSGVQSFSFTAAGFPGAQVQATLALTDGARSLGNVSFGFNLPLTTNYASGGGPIIIPDFGPARPYPAQIQVSGITGLVTKVTATLNGFTHTYPHDVSILLASPSGEELLLMSRVGGPYSVTNLNITFDDAATAYLPSTALSNGTFLPTTTVPDFVSFPGVPAPTAATALSIFDGTDPNGSWSLYVYDDTPGNDGVISNGWSLGLSTVSTVNPASRLEAGMINIPDTVFVGNSLDYQISITNQGPDDAANVVLTDVLPASLAFASADVSQGAATNHGNTVTCNLGTLRSGQVASIGISAVAVSAGSVVNTASVTTASVNLYLTASTTSSTAHINASLFAFLSATNTTGGLQLTLRGQPNQNYNIQISPDLVNWKIVTTVPADATGVFIYTDPQVNAPARFYRVSQAPQ